MAEAAPLDILYIDDEPDLREIVAVSLEMDESMTVRSAADAESAWQEIEARRPDLIILDVMMPGTDGPAFFAMLKARGSTADIPVVFMTAKVLEPELAMLRALDPAGIVQKPFDPRTLAAEIRRHRAASAKPSTTGGESLDAAVERLRRQFVSQAADTALQLRAGLALAPGDPASARCIAHRLCGIAGTIGFDEVSTLAADIDACKHDTPVGGQVERLAAALLAIAAPTSDKQA